MEPEYFVESTPPKVSSPLFDVVALPLMGSKYTPNTFELISP
jgi:hypothetical protein